jgi:GDP-L-fucose synthase
MKYKLTFLRDNLLINDNVLHCAYEAKVRALVRVAYGYHTDLPHR